MVIRICLSTHLCHIRMKYTLVLLFFKVKFELLSSLLLNYYFRSQI